jgi:hypothetical protein
MSSLEEKDTTHTRSPAAVPHRRRDSAVVVLRRAIAVVCLVRSRVGREHDGSVWEIGVDSFVRWS